MRPRNAERLALEAFHAAIIHGAGSIIALGNRIGHCYCDAGEESCKDDGEMHDDFEFRTVSFVIGFAFFIGGKTQEWSLLSRQRGLCRESA